MIQKKKNIIKRCCWKRLFLFCPRLTCLLSYAWFLPVSLIVQYGDCSIFGDDPLFTPVASDAWEALSYYRLDLVNTVFWDTQVCCTSFPCDTCLCTEWPLLPVPVLIILKDSASFFVGLLSRKRGLIGFFVMIKCKASRNPFDFNNYGCWCGLGGKGKPLDEVDR